MQQVTDYAAYCLKSVTVLLLCSISMLFTSCGSKTEIETGSVLGERVLRRGLPGEPATLDPQLADDTFSFQVLRDIFEGLTSESALGTLMPGVASSWTIDPAGTTYTFHLRPDAKWNDGHVVTADEFVEGLRHAVDPRVASGSASLLNFLKNATDITAGKIPVDRLGVSAQDQWTVRIELERPAPFFLEILSQPIAAPRHVHVGTSSFISNGPYELRDRVVGSHIELSRNPHYWDLAHVAINRIRYVNTESESTELREYAAGQLDLTYTLPMPDLDRAESKYGSELQTAPVLGTLYLALDLSEPPFRDNRELRQALSMAIDREWITKHLSLSVNPAYSFVAPGINNYVPPNYSWSTWSREQQLHYAQVLYGNSGFSQKRPLRLTLYFNTGEGIQRIMTAIAAMWRQNLGVETSLESREFRVFLTDRKDRTRWDVARLGWWADYNDPSSFLEIFSRNSPQNDPAYSDPEFNHLMDAARVETNMDRRMTLLKVSEEKMLSDYPIIPIYFYTARRLVKPYVGGAEITPLNRNYSKHLFWNPLRSP